MVADSDRSLPEADPPGPPAAVASRRPAVLAVAVAAMALAMAAGAVYKRMDRSTAPVVADTSTRMAPPAAPVSEADVTRGLHPLSDDQLQRMVDHSRARVQASPKDVAAWAMLAHSYDMLGKFSESSKAYASLAQLAPGDAQVLADYADALAVANGRTLAGEPTALVRKALAIDPGNVKALTLAGAAAVERNDEADAIAQWQKARALSHDPQLIRQIDANVANARAAAQGLPASAVAAAGVAVPVIAASGVVAGRLSLADDLRSKVPADATVFIFAIPVGGSRMPIALTRRHVGDLPLEFSLDDSMAMVRDLRLSRVAAVVVGARISRRGDVAPQSGDMQGLTAPVNVGTRGIKLEISEVLK